MGFISVQRWPIKIHFLGFVFFLPWHFCFCLVTELHGLLTCENFIELFEYFVDLIGDAALFFQRGCLQQISFSW